MGRGKPLIQCITPTCGETQFSKGLCRKCYNAAASLVGRNITTWDELKTLNLISETGVKFLKIFNRRTGGRLNKLKGNKKK